MQLKLIVPKFIPLKSTGIYVDPHKLTWLNCGLDIFTLGSESSMVNSSNNREPSVVIMTA